MNDIAVIIPTFGRSEKLEALTGNIIKTTKAAAAIYIVAERIDYMTINEAKRLGVNVIINSGNEYVDAINTAYRETQEEFLLLGADDIEFTKHWDTKMLWEMNEKTIGVVGAWDNFPITQTGKHTSHPLVRRSYIENFSGTFDEKNVVFSNKYRHYMADIELEQIAMKRAAFIMSRATIDHHHFVNGEVERDGTYTRSAMVKALDDSAYNRRKVFFEQYQVNKLHEGKIVPAMAVVIASYNQPQALKRCVAALEKNTKNPYTLYIVDDGSTDPLTLDFIGEDDQVIKLKKHGFTNNAWNLGVAKANTETFVAIVGNDNLVSKNWDEYLREALTDKDTFIASAYGKNKETGQTYVRTSPFPQIEGGCFMLKRESADILFPIPHQFIHWFGDNYLPWFTSRLGKKSVFVERATVVDLGHLSSNEFRESGILKWVTRGDALEFEKLTGIDVTKWLELNAYESTPTPSGDATIKDDKKYIKRGNDVFVVSLRG